MKYPPRTSFKWLQDILLYEWAIVLFRQLLPVGHLCCFLCFCHYCYNQDEHSCSYWHMTVNISWYKFLKAEMLSQAFFFFETFDNILFLFLFRHSNNKSANFSTAVKRVRGKKIRTKIDIKTSCPVSSNILLGDSHSWRFWSPAPL